MESNVFLKYRNNGNWTKRSATRSEFIRVILKSDKYAVRVRFEIKSKISAPKWKTGS